MDICIEFKFDTFQVFESMFFHRMQEIKLMWLILDNTPNQSYIHEYTHTKYIVLENAGKFIITTFALGIRHYTSI